MSDAPGVVYLWPQDGVEWDKLQVGGSLCAYDGPCYWMSEHAKKYVRADTITALEEENKRLRETYERVLIGGNHLVAHLPRDCPPYSTEPSAALQKLGSGLSYDLWCCWSAIMISRAALEGE